MIKKKLVTQIKVWVCTILSLFLLSNTSLANKNTLITNGLWSNQINENCLEAVIYYPDGSLVMVLSTGKKLLGLFSLEEITDSERLRLTTQILADNGMAGCDGAVMNYTNMTSVLYVSLQNEGQLMKMATTLKGKFFPPHSLKGSMAVAEQQQVLQNIIKEFQQRTISQPIANATHNQSHPVPQQNCGQIIPELVGKWRNELFLASGYSETNMIFYADGAMSNDFYSDDNHSSVTSATHSGNGGSWGVINGRVNVCFTNGKTKRCNIVDGSLMCNLPNSRKRKELWSPVR